MSQNTEVEEKNEVKPSSDRFLFREPVVLFTIIGLALMNGSNMSVQQLHIWDLIIHDRMPPWILTLYHTSQLAVPILGLIFFAFLSEVTGRKPAYIVLIIFSIISSIIHAFPAQGTVTSFGLVVQDILKGGVVIMNALSISEYCSPKHRFAYMLAQVAAYHTVGYLLPKSVFRRDLGNFSFTLVCLQLFQVVLGLVCLGSTWMWPESPYWLASKGRVEESRNAFLWLRREDGGKELTAVMEARRRPGPPRLYWISLLTAIATIYVHIFSNTQLWYSSRFYQHHVSHSSIYNIQFVILLGSRIVAFAVIAFISYHVNRKLLYLVVSGLSSVLSYAIALWIFLDPRIIENKDIELFYVVYFVLDVFQTCGPIAFSKVLFIEIIPQKYNTHMSCICLINNFILIPLLTALSIRLNWQFELYTPVSILLFTTSSLGGVILYYFIAPETQNKTLMEIQKMYTPDQSDANPEQDQIVMQNM